MGLDFSIKTILDLPFRQNHMAEILKRGSELGFVYYDHIMGERYENAPILNYEQASDKIINAAYEKIEGGPSVYTKVDDFSYAYIWFYETEEGYLEIYLGGFGSPKRKDYYIDLLIT